MTTISATAGDWIDVAPWRSPKLLLIHRRGDGSVMQAWNVGEKRDLLKARAGVLLAVWPGEYTTTCRQLSPIDRKRILAAMA